jgi:DNA-binding winged helix-turn-helix (wHTH) protein
MTCAVFGSPRGLVSSCKTTPRYPDKGEVGGSSLSNNISVVRKTLGENPQYIETIPKRGYRFVGAVRQLPSPPARHEEKMQLELASLGTKGPHRAPIQRHSQPHGRQPRDHGKTNPVLE